MSLCVLLSPFFAILQDLLSGFFGFLIAIGIQPRDLFRVVGPFIGCP
ncbi:MAG: hypothetical protein ACE5F9_14250 [Phycisphaerae bacterium]